MKTGDSVATTMRKQSDAELTVELDAAKAALYDMRHKRATRQTVKTSDYDMAKNKINMINMIMTERVAK
jgi:ribosomal protein L29